MFKTRTTFLMAFMSGGLKGKLLFIAAIVVALIITGTIIASFTFHLSIGESFWWAWTHVLDPGFLSDDASQWSRKLLGSIFSILGLVILGGTFITLAEEAAHRTFDYMKRGHLPLNIERQTIIAGSGQKLKSFIAAVNALPDKANDQDIVIVVSDSSLIDATREICKQHLRIVVGHIWEDDMQKKLNLAKAARIIILDNFGGDNGNMLTVLMCRKKNEPSGAGADDLSELKIYVEVNDRRLHASLRSFVSNLKSAESKTEINLLNMADASARIALRDHPLDCEPLHIDQNGRIVLIIYGWSTFADALFWQAVRIAHYPSKPTRIIVVHSAAEEIKNKIQSTAPGLFDNTYAKGMMSIEFSEKFSPESFGLTETHLVTVAVCGQNADEIFAKSMEISESPFAGLKQILLDLPDGSGYRLILKDIKWKIPLYAAGSHAEAFELSEKMDETAKAIHERYLQQREDQKKREKLSEGAYKDPSDYNWKDLDEIRRGWNRAAADHAEIKLRALADYHKLERPTRNVETGRLDITDKDLLSKIKELVDHLSKKDAGRLDALELLSRLEHDRWSAEKVAEGWIFGAQKDAQKKISPYLVTYNELDEKVKGYDRETVCEILKEYLKK